MFKHICLVVGLQTTLVSFGTEISNLKSQVTEGNNSYRIYYSLVKNEIKESKNIEKLETIESGILEEEINKTDDPNQFKISYVYYPINIKKTNTLMHAKIIYVDNHFKPLTSDTSLLSLPFYINNFRYGVSLNLTSELIWIPLLFNNIHTYQSSLKYITDYSHINDFYAEYGVATIEKLDSKNYRFTINWKGLRGRIKTLSNKFISNRINKYSRRHGSLIIDSNGTLQKLTVYVPSTIGGFESSSLITDQPTCLSIIKMKKKHEKKAFKKLRAKLLRSQNSAQISTY